MTCILAFGSWKFLMIKCESWDRALCMKSGMKCLLFHFLCLSDVLTGHVTTPSEKPWTYLHITVDRWGCSLERTVSTDDMAPILPLVLWKTVLGLSGCCVDMWGAGQTPLRYGSIARSYFRSHPSLSSNYISGNPSGIIIQNGLPARHWLSMVVQHHHLRQSFSLRRTWRARAGRGGTQVVSKWSLVHGEVKFEFKF